MKKQSKHFILKTPVMFSLCFFSFSISAPMQGDSLEKEFVVKSLLPSIECYFADHKVLKSSVFSFFPVISPANAQENPEFELSLCFDNNSSKEFIARQLEWENSNKKRYFSISYLPVSLISQQIHQDSKASPHRANYEEERGSLINTSYCLIKTKIDPSFYQIGFAEFDLSGNHFKYTPFHTFEFNPCILPRSESTFCLFHDVFIGYEAVEPSDVISDKMLLSQIDATNEVYFHLFKIGKENVSAIEVSQASTEISHLDETKTSLLFVYHEPTETKVERAKAFKESRQLYQHFYPIASKFVISRKYQIEKPLIRFQNTSDEKPSFFFKKSYPAIAFTLDEMIDISLLAKGVSISVKQESRAEFLCTSKYKNSSIISIQNEFLNNFYDFYHLVGLKFKKESSLYNLAAVDEISKYEVNKVYQFLKLAPVSAKIDKLDESLYAFCKQEKKDFPVIAFDKLRLFTGNSCIASCDIKIHQGSFSKSIDLKKETSLSYLACDIEMENYSLKKTLSNFLVSESLLASANFPLDSTYLFKKEHLEPKLKSSDLLSLAKAEIEDLENPLIAKASFFENSLFDKERVFSINEFINKNDIAEVNEFELAKVLTENLDISAPYIASHTNNEINSSYKFYYYYSPSQPKISLGKSQFGTYLSTLNINPNSIDKTLTLIAKVNQEPKLFDCPTDKVQSETEAPVEIASLSESIGDHPLFIGKNPYGASKQPRFKANRNLIVSLKDDYVDVSPSYHASSSINKAFRTSLDSPNNIFSTDELSTLVVSDEFNLDLQITPNPKEGGYLFYASLDPKNKKVEPNCPQNFIFLIDRSGSVDRTRFQTFKQAVSKSLSYLKDCDTFNIISFDTELTKMTNNSVSLTDSTKHGAKRFLEGLKKGYQYGLPNICEVLLEIEPMIKKSPLPTTVVLLTNTQTSSKINKDDPIFTKLMKSSKSKFSLFTAGCSESTDSFALELLSYLQKGESLTSQTHAALPRKLAALVKHATHLAASDIHIFATNKRDDTSIELFPKAHIAPNLYADRPYAVIGKINKLSDFDLVIQGKFCDNWVLIKKRISFSEAKHGGHYIVKEYKNLKAYDSYREYIEEGNLTALEEAKKVLQPLKVTIN